MTSARPLLFWLLISQCLLITASVWAQGQQAPTLRDLNEIKRLARLRVQDELPKRISTLLMDINTEAENRDLILNSYTLNDQNQQLFVSDNIIVEDDTNPDYISFDSAPDLGKTLSQYLNNLLSFVSKNADFNTFSFVVTNVRLTDPIIDSPTSAHISIHYESILKGKSLAQKTAGRSYQRVKRVATLQATRVNRKWEVLISQILFERPGANTPQTAAVVIAPAPPAVAETPPQAVDIREPLKIYRQPDYEFNVTVRSNKKALDVVKSESPRVPLGQYHNTGDGTYVLAGNSIRFDERDRDKFTYKNRDRDIMGFALLQPPKPKADTTRAIATHQRPPVVTPGNLPPNDDQHTRKANDVPGSTIISKKGAPETPKTITPVAEKPTAKPVVEVPKPVVEPDKPVVEPPKTVAVIPKPVDLPALPVPDKQAAKPSAPTPVLANVPKPVEKEKLPKPIVQKPAAMSVSPDLKKTLTNEQRRIAAGMRLRGWMQVVGGLAALGGSYVMYSGIKKDYDVYSQKVNALNADYNLYRDLSRRDVPPPPEPMSLTAYGAPVIYGVYGGGVVGLGLTVNGIRTLLRIRQVTKKK
ncbi:hypothetical protein [Fibrella forsythiae]|uniref:Uncharacterized protein n=1 Tax=Fibrella forsythiae TaxID=2817061 RepID=A0ABS3JKB1_9BACT|nr:hypothetical protein [Fibrella forsythiae]MBO0950438.1 hypothetical protein [Fibrella forsythiae]